MKTKQQRSASGDINKQMVEIKKKIQLSEGQRKAAFEDCEAERKSNIEEIHKLKKDISELVSDLKEKTQDTVALKALNKKLEALVGPVHDKTTGELRSLLDLQIIEKSKTLNLHQHILSTLGKEYQTLLSQKASKEVVEKVDKPMKKAICDLQNNIHAVEVQFREANHINVRYQDIKTTLQTDAAKFESNIKKIEEELKEQNNDINNLQQVMDEATHKRGVARGHLLQEEKSAMTRANARERQSADGRRLVLSRKQELELLEKRIFQVSKTRGPPAPDDEAVAANEDEVTETPSSPEDILAKAFDVLKQATGATTTDEVLKRFSAQKDTVERLVILRKKLEEEKKQLQKQVDGLNTQLEQFKYEEAKESERKSVKLDMIHAQISDEHQRSERANAIKSAKETTMKTILSAVRDLHSCINPLAVTGDDIVVVLEQIAKDLQGVVGKITDEDVEELDEMEDKWLPAPYSGLVRRTPVPQAGASPAPPPPAGSEDEEEVPSRTYLKRQAQLVVDAKSRRKNLRIQPQRT